MTLDGPARSCSLRPDLVEAQRRVSRDHQSRATQGTDHIRCRLPPCVFEDEHFGGAYDVQVVLADGSARSVGSFTAATSPWSWTVPLPVDAAEVREVQVRSPDGVVRAQAELD